MAKGLTASINRLATIIEGCDSNTSWRRSRQRLSTLKGEEAVGVGIDNRYWLGSEPTRNGPAAIAGSLHTMTYQITVELSRYWGAGDKNSKDYFGLLKTLEAQADIVEQNIMYPNNYDYDNTGICLINMAEPSTIKEPTAEQPIFLWLSKYAMIIRQANQAAQI